MLVADTSGASMSTTHFENDAHRSSLIRHLRQRKCPLKFAYAGSGTDTHVALADNLPHTELGARAMHEAEVLQGAGFTGEIPICDIGPSNGAHTAEFLRQCSFRGLRCESYLGLDYSQRLLAVAEHNLGNNIPIRSKFGHWDFENGPTRHIEDWRSGTPVLICLLGNTLGNVDNPVSALSNIYRSAQAGDHLLTSVTILEEGRVDQMLRPYRTPEFQAMVLQPLRAAGLQDEDVSLDVSFAKNTIFANAHLKRPVELLGVPFDAGESIECFRSRRNTIPEVKSLLVQSSWMPQSWLSDESQSQVSILSRRMELQATNGAKV
jgi:L-histidine Nalpha-methyltransferase